MNLQFSSFNVLKQCSHIFNIWSLSIRLIIFSIIFWVANELFSLLFPFNLENKLLFMAEKKFSTGVYCGEYWGIKEDCIKFLLYSFYWFLCWMGACVVDYNYYSSISDPHFERMNLSRLIRYSMNLNESTVFIRRWEKFQPFEEILDIKEIDLSKIMPLSSAFLFFLLHEYNGWVFLFMMYSSMFTTKSVFSIVLNNCIRYMVLLISNK